MWLFKIYVNGLFVCHVVGWGMISPNQVEGKLYPYIYFTKDSLKVTLKKKKKVWHCEHWTCMHSWVGA